MPDRPRRRSTAFDRPPGNVYEIPEGALDEPTPKPEEADMSKAKKVKAVYDLMSELEVSIYDLELWGHVSDREEELTVSADEAYEALVKDGFNLAGDGHAIGHYFQATSDYVGDALGKKGLLGDEA